MKKVIHVLTMYHWTTILEVGLEMLYLQGSMAVSPLITSTFGVTVTFTEAKHTVKRRKKRPKITCVIAMMSILIENWDCFGGKDRGLDGRQWTTLIIICQTAFHCSSLGVTRSEKWSTRCETETAIVFPLPPNMKPSCREPGARESKKKEKRLLITLSSHEIG